MAHGWVGPKTTRLWNCRCLVPYVSYLYSNPTCSSVALSVESTSLFSHQICYCVFFFCRPYKWERAAHLAFLIVLSYTVKRSTNGSIPFPFDIVSGLWLFYHFRVIVETFYFHSTELNKQVLCCTKWPICDSNGEVTDLLNWTTTNVSYFSCISILQSHWDS